jgi:predicted transcriptional regulator
MSKGFYISITNNLLDPKHCLRMENSVWLFMWFLDKMTKIDMERGIGLVLGGKPIKHREIEKDLGISRTTYWRYLKNLEKYGYIRLKRTPYGNIVAVNKAKKVFNQDVSEMKQGCSNNETSVFISETSNKTIQYDNKQRQVKKNNWEMPTAENPVRPETLKTLRESLKAKDIVK